MDEKGQTMKQKCASSKGNGCEITKQKLFIIRKHYRSEDPLGSREKMEGGGVKQNEISDQPNRKNKTSVFHTDIINQGKPPEQKEMPNRECWE